VLANYHNGAVEWLRIDIEACRFALIDATGKASGVYKATVPDVGLIYLVKQ
jgi:hypothetical protein